MDRLTVNEPASHQENRFTRVVMESESSRPHLCGAHTRICVSYNYNINMDRRTQYWVGA